MLTKRERLLSALRFERTGHVPLLGAGCLAITSIRQSKMGIPTQGRAHCPALPPTRHDSAGADRHRHLWPRRSPDLAGVPGRVLLPSCPESTGATARSWHIRTVWHSDGFIQPIVDSILATGVSGFQGFQLEYGVDIADIAAHRTVHGSRLTIFAGPSTAGTLRYRALQDVRSETERVIDTLAERCVLFLLPASSILPDCPIANVVEM